MDKTRISMTMRREIQEAAVDWCRSHFGAPVARLVEASVLHVLRQDEDKIQEIMSERDEWLCANARYGVLGAGEAP